VVDHRTWRAYRRLLGAQVRSQAQYRSSFIFDVIGQTAFSVLDFVTVLVLFRVSPTLAGFTLPQTLMFSSLAGTAFALGDLAVGNVERLKFYVRTGLLDAMLIRPRRVLPQLLANDFQIRRAGRVIFSAAVLVMVTATSSLTWNWWRILLVVVTPLLGAVFFAALFVTTASVAFWWIDSGEFANGFTYGGRDFTSYPLPVFDGLFRRFFGFGIGFGFVAYYPGLAILDIPDPLGMPPWFAAGGAVSAAGFSALAVLAWRVGIRHYKGTGS
jgi:ABC-2 type transport system permease protein